MTFENSKVEKMGKVAVGDSNSKIVTIKNSNYEKVPVGNTNSEMVCYMAIENSHGRNQKEKKSNDG